MIRKERRDGGEASGNEEREKRHEFPTRFCSKCAAAVKNTLRLLLLAGTNFSVLVVCSILILALFKVIFLLITSKLKEIEL